MDAKSIYFFIFFFYLFYVKKVYLIRKIWYNSIGKIQKRKTLRFSTTNDFRCFLRCKVNVDNSIAVCKTIRILHKSKPHWRAKIIVENQNGVIFIALILQTVDGVSGSVNWIIVNIPVSTNHHWQHSKTFRRTSSVDFQIFIVEDSTKTIPQKPKLQLPLVNSLWKILPLENAHGNIEQTP